MNITGMFKQYGLAAVVMILGIIISIIVHAEVVDNKRIKNEISFKTLASNSANAIVDGFSQALFAIESVGALYGSSRNISSRQFDAFVAPLLDRFPTIGALGWVPKIDHAERAEFEQNAQLYFPGFRINERNEQNDLIGSSNREIYFPVYFIQPYEGNEAAHGFDLYSNPVRRAAIDHALNTRNTTSTARIRSVQEQADEYSVLIIHPVFQQGGQSNDRREILGVASAVYRIGDGVEKALAQVYSDGNEPHIV